MLTPHLVRAATLAEVQTAGRLVVQLDGHAVVLFAQGDRIFAVDNRCPHMGFPLHRGTLKDGILTCHWHHARFDLATGGTFDPWADDVRVFPVEIRGSEVWVDLVPREDPRIHHRRRLREGLERDIPLVIGKAVTMLVASGDDPVESFRIGLEFGTRYRQAGWGPGLTILTCMMNLLPHLSADDRPRALYQGLSAVATNTAGEPPRFDLRPLPGVSALDALARWLRQFVEVRDAEGAERCIVSALRTGAGPAQMTEMLGAAATDHRYLTTGHLLDFTNKAFEALRVAGWQYAEPVLASLARGYAEADRAEEENAWRHPVDLVEILEHAFEALPRTLDAGRKRRGGYAGGDVLGEALLGEDPQAIADALLDALRDGASEDDLAGAVSHAAALRIARFPTTNEFGDWDTALHTFTFANAVQQILRRATSSDILRGVFDGAMSVYLDRFLNVPPVKLPEPGASREDADELLAELPRLLDRQQQVDGAADLMVRYLGSGGGPERLLAALGGALLREDRSFHTIQMMEASFTQFESVKTRSHAANVLVSAARYLAAHAPTVRAQDQTYQIAYRLHRGERLYAETDRVLATVLFADIAGSTERAAQLGDRRWRDLLGSYHTLVRGEITRFRGQELGTAGDGILASFDGAARAVRAALAIIEAARRIGLTVRAGLHTGEIELTGDQVSGICVHVGARVVALAAPGETLVTATLRDLVAGSGLRFQERGTHELKGVPGEWALFAVES